MVTVVKVETFAEKLANVEVKALVDTLPKTIARIQALQQGYRCYTLGKVEDRALVDTLGHRIAEKVRTFYNTVGKAAAEVLVNKVAPTIAVVTVRTLGDKLTKVQAGAMTETLAERLAHLEMKKLRLDNK